MTAVSMSAGEPPAADAEQIPIKVLVVDDDTSITEALLDFLTMMDIDASACNSAEAGMQAVLGDPALTVVVSDVRMPGRDGIGFAADIAAARGDDSAVSVVLITAFTSAAVAAVVDRQQIFAFLQKPFRPHALLEMVRLAHEAAVTRRRHSRDTGDEATDTIAAPAAPGSTSPADIIQAVAAALPAQVTTARRVCTLADCSHRLGDNSERVRDILTRVVDQLVSITRSGTVLTLSALESGANIEFRVDISPAMLGNIAASTEYLDVDEGIPSLVALNAEVREIGGRLSFAPHPTAVAVSCSLTMRGGVAAST